MARARGIDPFARLRRHLSSREPVHADETGRRQAAVAVILSPGPHGPEALFIRRAVRAGDPWSGHVGLPGGGREPADADLFAAAVRETREEVSVRLTPDSLLGGLDDLSPSMPGPAPLLIRPFVFGLHERPAACLSDEVAGLLWLNLTELPAAAARSVVDIRGDLVEVDSYVLGGALIWGLTYRIVRGLLTLL